MGPSRVLVVSVAVTLGLLTPQASASAVQLTKDNFETQVFGSGRNAFVKFLAPWCGHCKSMKPAWDKLAAAFEDSASVLIADVDCTADGGEAVCSENSVEGYPTIKYFTAETGRGGEDYGGDREFEGLEEFVKEKLARRCDVKTKEDCDDKEQAYIDKMAGKGQEAVEKESKRLVGMRGKDMKEDQLSWLNKRIAILELFVSGAKGEL